MMNGYAHVFELQMKYYRCALEKSGFQRTVRSQVEVVVVDGTRKDIGFLFLKNVDCLAVFVVTVATKQRLSHEDLGQVNLPCSCELFVGCADLDKSVGLSAGVSGAPDCRILGAKSGGPGGRVGCVKCEDFSAE